MTYTETHPWINFTVDLREASPELWMLLGEASSKCEHIAGVPLRPKTAEGLHRLYLAKGVLATTAIEGNTLTEEQVLGRIEGKTDLPPSQEYLGREVDNIIDACNEISSELITTGDTSISLEEIVGYNQIVLRDISLDDGIEPGAIRTFSVGVGNYRGAPHQDCEYLIQRLCDWLNGDDFKAPTGRETMFALLRAIIAHLYIAWIHPFGDGNGRTARLLEFKILLAAGVPSPAAHLLSNHYNLTRSEYYRQLGKASKTQKVCSFIEYALVGFVDGLRSELDLIRKEQWDVVWRNFVHERFSNNDTPAGKRQRHLVLDLSLSNDWVPLGDLIAISPRVAKAYIEKSPRTLTRDLEDLVNMELIERDKLRLRARKETILAFLPWRKPTT